MIYRALLLQMIIATGLLLPWLYFADARYQATLPRLRCKRELFTFPLYCRHWRKMHGLSREEDEAARIAWWWESRHWRALMMPFGTLLFLRDSIDDDGDRVYWYPLDDDALVVLLPLLCALYFAMSYAAAAGRWRLREFPPAIPLPTEAAYWPPYARPKLRDILSFIVRNLSACRERRKSFLR